LSRLFDDLLRDVADPAFVKTPDVRALRQGRQAVGNDLLEQLEHLPYRRKVFLGGGGDRCGVCLRHRGVEATPLTRMAGWSRLVNPVQQGVGVAVTDDFDDAL